MTPRRDHARRARVLRRAGEPRSPHARRGPSRRRSWAPPGEEAVVVLLEGALEWAGAHAARRSVFAGPRGSPSTSRRAPRRTSRPDRRRSSPSSRRSTPASPIRVTAPTVVGPDEVVVHDRGEPGWQREVHDVIADAVPAERLLVGETFKPARAVVVVPAAQARRRATANPRSRRSTTSAATGRTASGSRACTRAAGEAEAVFVSTAPSSASPAAITRSAPRPARTSTTCGRSPGAERRLAMYEDPVHRWLHDT